MPRTKPIPPAEDCLTAFEEDASETTAQTVCAILNTGGGRIFFGVTEEGAVAGIENPDRVTESVLEQINRDVRPEATAFCRVHTIEVDGCAVVVLEVLEGSLPPYYATRTKENGKKETACWLRKGKRNVKATDEDVRRLHEKGDPTPQELLPSPRQTLTFGGASVRFAAAGIDFSAERFAELGLTNPSGFFTNLALWLSDQCRIETKVAFFAGLDKASAIKAVHTFTGTILHQYADILECLEKQLGSPRVTTEGYPRNSAAYCPEAALRETLIDFFAHRDFGFPAPATVSVFSDRMEFLSFGVPLPETDPELLRLGAPLSRNPKLAGILSGLFTGGRYGLGLPEKFTSYAACGLEPKITAFSMALLITLPKITPRPENLGTSERRILDFLERNGPSKRAEIQDHLGKSYGLVIGALNAMEKRNLIAREGGGRHTRYRLR